MIDITNNFIIDEDINNILSEKLEWTSLGGKNILVTGANGMLPSYLIYTFLGLNETILQDNPIKIVALVRNRERALIKFSPFMGRNDFELVVMDVSFFSSYNKKLDIIIHAASQASPKYYGIDPVGTLKANTIGTMNLLEIARKKKIDKFLFISSGDVYGMMEEVTHVVDETCTGNVDITSVRSCYGESKRMGENMCICYAWQYGIDVFIVRLAHTYGPGVDLNDGRVFADFVHNIVNGEKIKINSDGTAFRCFLYITDMIRGLFYVLFRGVSKNAYNISSMIETSIKNLAETICALYPEKKIKLEYVKKNENNSYIRSKSQGLVLDNNKIKKLGWKQNVSLSEGFRRMIDSFDAK